MGKPCCVLLCLVGFVLSGAIQESIKPRPGQFIKQMTFIGRDLPLNASKLEVCIRSEPNVDTCDVYNTTASFSPTSSKKLTFPKAFTRIFFNKIVHTKTNIFAAKGNITLTLKNSTHDIYTALLYPNWITKQMHNDGIILTIFNRNHPDLPDLLGIEKWKTTGNDSYVRSIIIAAVKLEVFCDSEYYGEECIEHCPQGCAHGTCDNGTCSDCKYPYHGESCDLCGENGNCVHGVCKEPENDNIMSGKCECNAYYEGPQCDRLTNNCTIVPCSAQGRCDMYAHKCVCYGRYGGDFCEIYLSYWQSRNAVKDCLLYGTLIVCFLFASIKLKWSEWAYALCTSDMDEFCAHNSKEAEDFLNRAIRLDMIEGPETYL